MAQQAVKQTSQHPAQKGVIGGTLSVITGAFFALLMALFFSIVYARHGHKLMGCKSPVGGSPLCKLYPT
ncbi:MAG: hypothetical protein KZQ57_04110, partial [gamma proteobacterium symbiont of Lucinoma myriamae]|nr:hypothetical protein [gamma proteobacterium symbiont of Lucinoma myriamae]